MKKYFLISLCLFLSSFLLGQKDPQLVDIPHAVFVNGGSDDFSKILSTNEHLKEAVSSLYLYNELSHDYGHLESDFDTYWSHFSEKWHFIHFSKDRAPLLLFMGLRNFFDEREYVEIYDMERLEYDRNVYNDIGRLLAYKINPHTKEVVLYSHKYPCCKSASHNIYSIRFVQGKIKLKDRFFVGRDKGDMKGVFFPSTVNYDVPYQQLTKRAELRWSPEIIDKDAFIGWTPSNLITHYEAGALYKSLAQQGEWEFVLFFNGIAEEQSMMLNYTNFRNKGVYGWIRR